jgi:hypothetical protein
LAANSGVRADISGPPLWAKKATSRLQVGQRKKPPEGGSKIQTCQNFGSGDHQR